MKKTMALIFALSLASLSLASCSSSDVKPSDKDLSEVVTTTAADEDEEDIDVDFEENTGTTVVTTEAPVETAPAQAKVEGEFAEFDAEPSDDFTEISSEKYITALTSGKYNIVYDGDQILAYDNGNSYTTTFLSGAGYANIYKDGVFYTITGDSYTKTAAPEGEEPLKAENRFEGYGYVGSGEAIVDGKQYKYDEFRHDETVLRIFLDDKNEVAFIQEADNTMRISKFETEFDSEKVFALPSGIKEKDVEEFNDQLQENIDQANKDINKVSEPAETDQDDL